MDLYCLCVITILEIFDADTCYSEYCESEFEQSEKWESIVLDDENYNGPYFYIKNYEF